jgi:hypothetical protein
MTEERVAFCDRLAAYPGSLSHAGDRLEAGWKPIPRLD